jgi:hypothetical protein
MMRTAVAVVLGIPCLVFANETIYSYTLDKCYTVTVPREALKASPAWDVEQENPPLSARKAIKLANGKKGKLVRDSKDWKWNFSSASLQQGDEDQWYWLVSYEAWPKKGGLEGVAPFLRLVVLMDGTVIEPKEIADPRRRE